MLNLQVPHTPLTRGVQLRTRTTPLPLPYNEQVGILMHCETMFVTDTNNCHSAFHNSKFQHVSLVRPENKEKN